MTNKKADFKIGDTVIYKGDKIKIVRTVIAKSKMYEDFECKNYCWIYQLNPCVCSPTSWESEIFLTKVK